MTTQTLEKKRSTKLSRYKKAAAILSLSVPILAYAGFFERFTQVIANAQVAVYEAAPPAFKPLLQVVSNATAPLATAAAMVAIPMNVASQPVLNALTPVAPIVQAQSARGQLTSGYTRTRYPIVLVHGFTGFDRIVFFEYWYGIPRALRKDGANVHVASVSQVNSTEVRGEQLLAQVKQILASTGASKVNLIGHSHGGPTVRYVASVRPDLVASVTSIAGPNKGVPGDDHLVLPLMQQGLPIEKLFGSVGTAINTLSNGPFLPQNPLAAFSSLSTHGMFQFNQAHPWGVPSTPCGEGAYSERGVAYYSWAGAKQITNLLDPTDALFSAVGMLHKGEKNDGLVGSCSSHLGQVIRDDYNMNHFDEINQMVGLVSWNETNPVSVFRQHANRLKNAGY